MAKTSLENRKKGNITKPVSIGIIAIVSLSIIMLLTGVFGGSGSPAKGANGQAAVTAGTENTADCEEISCPIGTPVEEVNPLSNQSSESPPDPSTVEQPLDPTTEQPPEYQEITMKISGRFVPNTFTVKAGQQVKWTIIGERVSGCVNEVIQKDFDIDVQISTGETKTVYFTPTKPGTYSFSCWMNMVRGTIKVI